MSATADCEQKQKAVNRNLDLKVDLHERCRALSANQLPCMNPDTLQVSALRLMCFRSLVTQEIKLVQMSHQIVLIRLHSLIQLSHHNDIAKHASNLSLDEHSKINGQVKVSTPLVV